MGDTTVYPILNTKENRQVVMGWNGEVKKFEQRMKLVHLRWEEVPEVRGVKGYLGIWVEGFSSEREVSTEEKDSMRKSCMMTRYQLDSCYGTGLLLTGFLKTFRKSCHLMDLSQTD